MEYCSTRDNGQRRTSAEAIVKGIAFDGGLYMPLEIPGMQGDFLSKLLPLSYTRRAVEVLSLFLTDYSRQELTQCAAAAYDGKFDSDKTAPVVGLREDVSVLELFHGPTCAFKDFALQILPHLLRKALDKTGVTQEVAILTATSGDTGKAALAGFSDAPGTRICVFYPKGGVSSIQRLQMVTQKGENVKVLAVEGNFDDCQSGVKSIFTDGDYCDDLQKKGFLFSSANSINWGRLAPQIVYYFHGYLEMVRQGRVTMGQKINVCVPTGNFGNILAAYLAGKMGLPIKRLLCASNANRVLTDLLDTGAYDRNREFFLTASPSMDILISSNLERLLYLVSGRKDRQIRQWMEELAKTGRYTLTEEVYHRIREDFWGGSVDDVGAEKAISRFWREQGYLADPHTAVGLQALQDYRDSTGDGTPVLAASTASPYKFSDFVLKSAFPKEDVSALDPFARLRKLEELSKLPMPASLSVLETLPVRFPEAIALESMPDAVRSWLTGIQG